MKAASPLLIDCIKLRSNSQKWKEGAKFGGNLPFSTYQIIDDKAGIWPLGDTPDEQMSLAIGALGNFVHKIKFFMTYKRICIPRFHTKLFLAT